VEGWALSRPYLFQGRHLGRPSITSPCAACAHATSARHSWREANDRLFFLKAKNLAFAPYVGSSRQTKRQGGDVIRSMQKFLRLFLVASLVFSCAFWHAPEGNCASAETKLPLEVAMQSGDPLFTVEVMINGQGPFVFAFDTGAQADPRIDVSLVEKLKLKSTGQVQATDPSRRSYQASETYKVDSLALGSLRLTDVTVVGRNFQNSPRPLK